MPIRHGNVGFVAAVLLTIAQLALPAQAQSDCKPMPALSIEQRLMLFADMQKATAGQPAEAVRDYRQKERQKLAAMAPADRDRYLADLAKRWNGLPAEEKSKIKDAALAFRASHPGMGGPHRGADCAR